MRKSEEVGLPSNINCICFTMSAEDRGKHGVRHANKRGYTPVAHIYILGYTPGTHTKKGIHRIHNCIVLGYALAERVLPTDSA